MNWFRKISDNKPGWAPPSVLNLKDLEFNMPDNKTDPKPLDRKNWLVLALAYAEPSGLSSMGLQKTLFLIGTNLPEVGNDYYKFEAGPYGPYAKVIFQDADLLMNKGLVFTRASDPQYPDVQDYRVTPTGNAMRYGMRVSPTARVYLRILLDWVNSSSSTRVNQAVLAAFPKYGPHRVFHN